MSNITPVSPNRLQRADEPIGSEGPASLSDLRNRIGLFEEYRTNRALSKRAGEALREIEGNQIASKMRLANTAITIAETQVATAMIARAVPVISGAMERLNAQAIAADQAYSAQEGAAIQSHFHFRQKLRGAIERDVEVSGLSEQERDAALSFADANLADDINRTRARTQRCKQAADALYDRALSGFVSVRLPSAPSN